MDTVFDSIIQISESKVFGEHNYEVLTSSRDGLQKQSEHFGTEQRHDTDGYNIIPLGYCTYRNRSDDGNFTFNVNNISTSGIVSKFYPVFKFVGANSTFITEYLNTSHNNKKKLSTLAVGTSQVVLSISALRSALFSIPSEQEQNKIAALIEKLNLRITKQHQLVKLLKKYKRGLLNRYFCSNFEHRDCVPLSQLISEIMDGDWIESKDQSSSGFRLIQTGNVGIGEYIDKPDSAKYISESTFERLHCTEIYPGDILISRLPSPAGRGCIIPTTNERMITAVDCTIIRCDDTRCIREYLIQFLNSPQYFKNVESFLAGGTRQRISRKNLESISIPVVTLEEQKNIAEVLSTFDKRIHNANGYLQALIRYKRGLLQALFV